MPLTPEEEVELAELNRKAGIATSRSTTPNQEQFVNSIATVETGGTKDPYKSSSKTSSAAGKYQFLWNSWNKEIQKFAGKPLTKQQFLNDPQLQEDWARHYYQTQVTPQANAIWSKYGNKLKAMDIRSPEEAKALVHFIGASALKQLATTGKYTVPGKNISIPMYLSKFRAAGPGAKKTKPAPPAPPAKARIRINNDVAEVPKSELNAVLGDFPNAIILD